jgi:polar amino acid transport system substrate-binding protein
MTDRVSRRLLAAGGLASLAAASLITPAHAEGPEYTIDRITRTKTLRIAVLPGELPYFKKDIVTGEWSGAAIAMAKDLAAVWGAQLAYVESTYGNSVLDLQSNKIDLAFALNPTPQRALAIGFTHPMIIHPFGALTKPGFSAKTWDDLNKPEVRLVYQIGSLYETCTKRFAPKASSIGMKTADECILQLQSGHADANILAAILGLSAVGKNPQLGTFQLLHEPLVALPSNLGIQREPDTRFADVVNAWLDLNRGTGQIREWLLDGLALAGVKREQVPAELTF